jgi:hypothetical protein
VSEQTEVRWGRKAGRFQAKVPGISIDLRHPLLDVVERFCGQTSDFKLKNKIQIGYKRRLRIIPTLICHIEDNDDAVCTSVVRACDGPESLLAGSVPNL